MSDFTYSGVVGSNLIPIAGDWDGNGTVTTGLYDPTKAAFYLKNSNTNGLADITFTFGMAGNWKPIVGDWDGNGTDTIGLYDPTASRFYLKNSNSHGNADVSFTYGMAGNWIPIDGHWGAAALLAANQMVASASTPALTQAELQPIVNEAIARWSQRRLGRCHRGETHAGPVCHQRSAGLVSGRDRGEPDLHRQQCGRLRLVRRSHAGVG